MARYLIKVTYLDGRSKGRSYYLRKGGHVTNEQGCQLIETTYASYGTCLRECKRLDEQNKLDISLEQSNREWKRKKGWNVSKFPIFDRESYEPYEVPSHRIYVGI